MNKKTQKHICMIPVVLWVAIIPLIVKIKYYPNPLKEYPWYSQDETLVDFFLYYKSIFIIFTGAIMFCWLCWQIMQMRKINGFISTNTRIFIPIIVYLLLSIVSSIHSEYRYFCIHGMPDQFESLWCLAAYVIAMLFFYYAVAYKEYEKEIFTIIYIGILLVGLICVLQFFCIDIYRYIYSGDGYTFVEKGMVYGPFYNINYVGYYTLLFVPLLVLNTLFYQDMKVKFASAILAIFLILALIGAKSSAGEVALFIVLFFAIIFLLLKNVKRRKILWIPIIGMVTAVLLGCLIITPKIQSYIKSIDTEKTNLENLFTNDDNIEVHYKGQTLFVSITKEDNAAVYHATDQEGTDLYLQTMSSDEGYSYYIIDDERFRDITITPILMEKDSQLYGAILSIDDKDWVFTNQLTDDGTYYYLTDVQSLTKLTQNTPSDDFAPLIHMSSLGNGRGYIWNKTIAMLQKYLFLGSGADTFTLVYPNGDFVDKYNNGYDNLIISKPHNMYLQIAVQTGVLSLFCFLVFYAWYFFSSLRIYFKHSLNNELTIAGFSIMLGTLGYMISALANDSTATVTPLYWALMGIGIGINHKIKSS